MIVDDDKLIALQAAITLACLDANAQPMAVRAVQKALTVKDADADRSEVCRFVEAVGPNASFAVPFLKRYMISEDDSDQFNWEIVDALASIGFEAAATARHRSSG